MIKRVNLLKYYHYSQELCHSSRLWSGLPGDLGLSFCCVHGGKRRDREERCGPVRSGVDCGMSLKME